MRTTLDIDEDVLFATKEMAKLQGLSMGKVISNLARETLSRPIETTTRQEVPLFPRQPHAGIVTLALINQLRDEMP